MKGAAQDELIGKLNAANHAMLERPEVTLVDGTARFVGPRTVAVETTEGEQRITGATVVIGTGTTPRPFDVPGGDGARVYDSTTIQHVDPFPQRLVIVGGGFIGLEFAGMFAHFGAEVTVLDGGDTFLPRLDRDVAEEAKRTLQDQGVTFVQSAKVTEITEDGEGAVVHTEDGQYAADAVLAATGLLPGGRLAFETRNPALRAWEDWTSEPTETTTTAARLLESEVTSAPDHRGVVVHRWRSEDLTTGTVQEGEEHLQFRSPAQVRADLEAVGLSVERISGGWDRREFDEAPDALMVVEAVRG